MASGKRFVAEDGRCFVPVVITEARAFARACLEVWAEGEGKDRRARMWMMDFKALSVPLQYIEPARARMPAIIAEIEAEARRRNRR
ncbi:hypothetical protein SAMN02983003_1057 [Devosia enhydra]|uniref:Uncharacterized protein n=1 Tax=Devosia enhydra TaxID=665118 RepID=A0A1K2HV16_9HYPH|nr:hypothetical protein [Devosia enhydra]SFZ82401.1 hypothetical protein SAMN02983003_1057 [Devosia enhydra]